MFEIVGGEEVALKARNTLWAALSKGAREVTQRLSTPGGAPAAAKLLVRKDLDIWAYLGERPDEKHYLFWLGIGEPSWQAAIEINIPVQRNLYNAGQLVADDNGVIHLAHRGGLGGGKFSVAADVFSGLIRGFETDAVSDGKRTLQYFVLGVLSNETLLPRLANYVHEAVRIRDLRKRDAAYRGALAAIGREAKDVQPQEKTTINRDAAKRAVVTLEARAALSLRARLIAWLSQLGTVFPSSRAVTARQSAANGHTSLCWGRLGTLLRYGQNASSSIPSRILQCSARRTMTISPTSINHILNSWRTSYRYRLMTRQKSARHGYFLSTATGCSSRTIRARSNW